MLRKLTQRLIKFLLISLLIAAFIFAIYWLWQRQPKQLTPKESKLPATYEAQRQNQQLQITPADGSVLTSPNLKLKGTLGPNNLILIYSNSHQAITKTNQTGNFETEISLTNGLNLINLSIISFDLQETGQRYLTLWLAQNSNEGKTVAAGTVKSIFDTLVTITSQNGDKNIRTGKSTKFDIPKEDSQSLTTGTKDIRIGDFVVALGEATDEDTIVAQSLAIIRENKPQNTKEFAIGKTITGVKNNLFSVKNNKDGKIIEFTLNKNSVISLDGQEALPKDISKDKTAIIIFHQSDDKNIADLLYLLPDNP